MSRQGPRAHLNIAMFGALALLALLTLAHVPGLTAGLAYLSPALFAFLLLWLGRYPGERTILALITPARQPRTRRTRTLSRRGETRMGRGGTLLAEALAGRAPPLSAHR